MDFLSVLEPALSFLIVYVLIADKLYRSGWRQGDASGGALIVVGVLSVVVGLAGGR
jgi:hypothetical protein